MSWLAIGVCFILAVLSVIWVAALVQFARRPDPLEELGVRPTYPSTCLPTTKIDSYYELRDRLQGEYGKGSDSNLWMSLLPAQAKDALKYRLMQRAIGDMAALQKVDIDARGYWRLFSKGIVTQKFWSSVVEAEKELSSEIESVKQEAACVEPKQDPQGIIAEAMQYVVRFGDQLPSAEDRDMPSTADALAELMKHYPMGAAGAGKLPGGLPAPPPGAFPGGPGGGLPPPGFRPPGPPPVAPAAPSGGEEGVYSWKQDGEELEVSVEVPGGASKADAKVVMQPRSLKVLHKGVVLIEGALAGVCVPDGSTWTLGKGRLVVSLEKANPKPWPTLFAAAKA